MLHDKVSAQISTYFDWMFLAQHFGLSTPLLDWSDDYQVALWFASSSNDRTHKNYNNECVEDYDVSDDEFSNNYMGI